MKPSEIIFEVTEAVEGGYDARALGYSIFTQGEDWADLKEMARDAILCHFGVNECAQCNQAAPRGSDAPRRKRGFDLALN